MCAVEYSLCLSVKVLPKDSAIVQMTGVDQALCSIFEKQVTLSILLRLKESKLSTLVGCQSLLWGEEI